MLACLPLCMPTSCKAHAHIMQGAVLTAAVLPAPPCLPATLPCPAGKVRVAIIREEGSNGDREMASAVYAAGMEPWDVHMSDLLAGAVSLDAFQGIVFVGGFRCGARRAGQAPAAAGPTLNPK